MSNRATKFTVKTLCDKTTGPVATGVTRVVRLMMFKAPKTPELTTPFSVTLRLFPCVVDKSVISLGNEALIVMTAKLTTSLSKF